MIALDIASRSAFRQCPVLGRVACAVCWHTSEGTFTRFVSSGAAFYDTRFCRGGLRYRPDRLGD